MSAGPETAIILRGCFQSPAPYPLPFREKVKFGPSLTDQRAGPISWWPSTPVKMLTHPYCQCFTFFFCIIAKSKNKVQMCENRNWILN